MNENLGWTVETGYSTTANQWAMNARTGKQALENANTFVTNLFNRCPSAEIESVEVKADRLYGGFKATVKYWVG